MIFFKCLSFDQKLNFFGSVVIPIVIFLITIFISYKLREINKEIKVLNSEFAEIKNLKVDKLVINGKNKDTVIKTQKGFSLEVAPNIKAINVQEGTGHVGIGVAVPSTRLEVNGEILIHDIHTGSLQGTPLCIDKSQRICACGSCNF